MEPALPHRIGPYRVLRRLGQGGMAEVFLALATGASGFEKRVAIKRLLPELSGEGELERLLIEEARLGARLGHRNLVGVHELGVDGGAYFVRMDWVDGVDLAAVLAQGPLPPPLALLVAEELALGLAALHAAVDDAGRPLGLVHRDVSPSNVLLSRAGEVKLADLGIAKATLRADMTRANVRKGKYAYMSPEQVAGEPVDGRSDQFSLGITLHEMLRGARPFDGDTPLETMERIRAAAPPSLAALEPALAEAIHRCLGRLPSERWPDTETLCRALGWLRQSFATASPFDLAARVVAAMGRGSTEPGPVAPTTRSD